MKRVDLKLVWNGTMSVLYMGMGVFIIAYGTSLNSFSISVNRIFGIVMIGYGIFRLIRMIMLTKKLWEVEDEN